jgi:hypothetical protein
MFMSDAMFGETSGNLGAAQETTREELAEELARIKRIVVEESTINAALWSRLESMPEPTTLREAMERASLIGQFIRTTQLIALVEGVDSSPDILALLEGMLVDT